VFKKLRIFVCVHFDLYLLYVPNRPVLCITFSYLIADDCHMHILVWVKTFITYGRGFQTVGCAPLGGVVGSRGGGSCLYEGNIYFERSRGAR
jgi:hypothetical protein